MGATGDARGVYGESAYWVCAKGVYLERLARSALPLLVLERAWQPREARLGGVG